LMPRLPEAAANLRRASILPDYGPVHGRAAGSLPKQRGLTLVGDAHRRDVAAAHARLAERTPNRSQSALPDLLGLVLHPTRLWKILRELDVAAAEGLALEIHHESRGPRRALIDSEDVFAVHGGRVTRACRHDEGQLPMAEHPAENTPAPVTAAQSPSAGETSAEPAA